MGVDTFGPDIIALTESWLTPDVCDSECTLENYTLFRADRVSGTVGGGVMLYCRSYLNPILISAVANMDGSEEFLCCRVKLKEGSTLIGVAYRAPNSDGVLVAENLAKVC